MAAEVGETPAAQTDVDAGSERLSHASLLAYAAPITGYMMASMPLSLWFGKFATDTLLMPAAAMGTIHMVARIWDGISDPLAGHLSDRTQSRLGRRRSWMLASTLPIVLTLVALWTPPAGLEGLGLILWMGAAYVLWETASTILLVPYSALGNELTQDYHERTRLFGWRHLVSSFGYAASLGFVYLLRTASASSVDEARSMATAIALASGLFVAVSTIFAVRLLPEPQVQARRGGVNLWRAMRDVFRNPHARVLLAVYTIETFGMGSISFLTPYVLDDVVGAVDYLEVVLVCWIVPQFALTPVWMRISRRVGKKPLWLFGMIVYSLGFSASMFIYNGGVPILIGIVLVLGMGGGIANVVAPSIQADVIDWDELQSGERKEGAYMAVWNLVRKVGYGLAGGISGVALGLSGYDGAAEVQTEAVKWTILVFVGLVPASAYALGAIAMARFRLNEEEHADVLRQIRARRLP